jgi:hypothetical protein
MPHVRARRVSGLVTWRQQTFTQVHSDLCKYPNRLCSKHTCANRNSHTYIHRWHTNPWWVRGTCSSGRPDRSPDPWRRPSLASHPQTPAPDNNTDTHTHTHTVVIQHRRNIVYSNFSNEFIGQSIPNSKESSWTNVYEHEFFCADIQRQSKPHATINTHTNKHTHIHTPTHTHTCGVNGAVISLVQSSARSSPFSTMRAFISGDNMSKGNAFTRDVDR